MFKGCVLGVWYYTWESFRNAYNEAVEKGLLRDKKGNKITKKLEETDYKM